MTCISFAVMSNLLKPLKKLSTPRVIEHGLLVGIVLVLMNGAIKLEALEIMTGMIGALAVFLMKENSSRQCQKLCPDSDSNYKIGSRLHKNEPTTQLRSVDETPTCDAEFAQLKACVQAELNVLRAECKLEAWKNKADQAEVELVQLNDEIAELERDLSQQQSAQPWTDQTPQTRIEELFVLLTEAKLRAEKVEAELVQAQTNMAECENAVAEATSIQNKAEEESQMQLEALSTDLIHANDQSAIDVSSAMWLNEDF